MTTYMLKADVFLHQLQLFHIFLLQCQSHTTGTYAEVHLIMKGGCIPLLHHNISFHIVPSYIK